MEQTPVTKKYTVLKGLEYPRGTVHEEGSVLELTDEQAAKFAEGLIEEVKEEATEENKAEETKENAEETKEEAPEEEQEETQEEQEEEEEQKETDEKSSATEEFEDNGEKVTVYGVFTKKGALVKNFTLENHGENFKELAEKYAERKGENFEARPNNPKLPEEVVEKDTVKVLTRNNQIKRVFSKEVHGDDYLEKAEQFVAKYATRKGYKLQKLEE